MTIEEVYVPSAETRARAIALATRLNALAGCKIAWLDNQKANAPELLAVAANTLQAKMQNLNNVFASKDATKAAPESVMAHLKTCDAVVLAIAD